jgi:hypothetical protein
MAMLQTSPAQGLRPVPEPLTDNDDHVEGMKLCISNEPISGSIVHPPGDTSMENHGGMTQIRENS